MGITWLEVALIAALFVIRVAVLIAISTALVVGLKRLNAKASEPSLPTE